MKPASIKEKAPTPIFHLCMGFLGGWGPCQSASRGLTYRPLIAQEFTPKDGVWSTTLLSLIKGSYNSEDIQQLNLAL